MRDSKGRFIEGGVSLTKGMKFSDETKARMKSAFKGRKITKEARFKMSLAKLGKPSLKKGVPNHEFSGEKHPNWKGGKHIDEKGYVIVYCPNHQNSKMKNYVYEHRLIMEKHIGRVLKKGEVVHHINEIKSDNRIENLQLFESHKDHANFHISKRSKE